MKKLVLWEINVDSETFDLFMESFRKSGFKTKLEFHLAMVKKYSEFQTTEMKKSDIQEVFEGLKNDPPEFEEKEDSEEIEPQEGDLVEDFETGEEFEFQEGELKPLKKFQILATAEQVIKRPIIQAVNEAAARESFLKQYPGATIGKCDEIF